MTDTPPSVNTFAQFAPLIIQQYESYLPNAFDDSLSMLQKVNKIINSLNTLGSEFNSVVAQWNEAITWVEGTGLTDAVDNLLNQWKSDGTLSNLIGSDVLARLNDITQNKTIEHLVSKMINGQAVKIVCFGDSVTWGKSGDTGVQIGTPYPAKLQALLQEYYQNNAITVINQGYSGENSQFLVDNVTDVTSLNPDLVLIMIGLNDKQGWDESTGTFVAPTDINTFVNNLDSVRKSITDANGRVMFISPTPCYSKSSSDTINDQIQKQMTNPYVKAMENYCKKTGYDYFDINHQIEKYFDYQIARYTEVSADNIHWNQDFYNHIAECIFAFNFVAHDIIVNDIEKSFTASQPIHRFKGGTPTYWATDICTEKTYAQFNGSINHFAYVFINSKEMQAYLTSIKGSSGDGNCVATVDSVNTYDFSCNNSQDGMFGLDLPIGVLPYGLHKIELNLTNSASTNVLFLQNIHFKNVPPTVLDSSFKTYRKLTSSTAVLGNADVKPIVDLPLKNTHYRFYLEVNNSAGFAIGKQKYWNSGVVDTYNSVYFYFKDNTLQVHRLMKTSSNGINTQPTFLQMSSVTLSKTFVSSGLTLSQIDLVISNGQMEVYVDGTLEYTLTDMLVLGESLNLSLLNYTNTTYAVESIIQNIYDLCESTTPSVGEEYIDDTTFKKMCYINGVWVALN